MRILMVHNSYRHAGGEDQSAGAEAALLASHDDEVVWYRRSNLELSGHFNPLVGARAVFSLKAYRDVSRLLSRHQIDVVHVQNYFPLISPSVYYAARRARCAVVQTLRNFRTICPNGLLFRDGSPCDSCVGKTLPWPAVRHGCYRKSRIATLGPAAMIAAHRWFGTWTEAVDAYIALTPGAAQRFRHAGLPHERLFVKPNCIHSLIPPSMETGQYALFVGRVTEEKGVKVLSEAWRKLETSLPLLIVGEGPLVPPASAADERDIRFLGQRDPREVRKLMAGAMCVIVPSLWSEPFGRVVVEAYSVGTPVIASAIGALPELVVDGRTGLLFRPGDATGLARQVARLKRDKAWQRELREGAYSAYCENFAPESNYSILKAIYRSAMEARARDAQAVT